MWLLMRVRVNFDIPPLYMDLTPAQIEALEDEFDWQPFIDASYSEIEDHLMGCFSIDDVRELSY